MQSQLSQSSTKYKELITSTCRVTHIFHSLHLLRDALKDVGEGHLVVVIQQRVDGFLQTHELLLSLHMSPEGS